MEIAKVDTVLANGQVNCQKVHVLVVPKNRLCARNLAIYMYAINVLNQQAGINS